MRLRIAGIALLVTGIAATIGQAQPPEKPAALPLERNELDKRLAKIIFDSETLGTDLYNNKNDFEGCYRLYQGTVMAVLPFLDNRPILARSVREKLEQSKTMGQKQVEGAMLLRKALDEIQNDIAPQAKELGPKATGTAPEVKQTLWDRLGGPANVGKIVDFIIFRASEDPKVKFMRSDKKLDIPALRQHLIDYISSITGGPLAYKGKDMKMVHAGMKITDSEFTAFEGIIEEALKKNNVAPTDIKEFMALIETTRKDIVTEKSKN